MLIRGEFAANTAASSGAPTRVRWAKRSARRSRPGPGVVTAPVDPMDERCPSPIPRTLIKNRRLPAAVSVWSGWATMLGLHSAAPSMAYSLVKVAPSNSIRASERWMPGSRRSASSWACRRNVPTRSRWRPSKRMMTSSRDDRTSSSSARMRLSTTPRDPCARTLPTGQEPGITAWITAIRWGAGDEPGASKSCGMKSAARAAGWRSREVDSAPWLG